jgi:hypothetical protein
VRVLAVGVERVLARDLLAVAHGEPPATTLDKSDRQTSSATATGVGRS